MIRNGILVVLVTCSAAMVHAGSTLAESWLRVQQALASQDYDVLDQRILEFQQAADDVAVRRLTPYADALVTWAKDHPKGSDTPPWVDLQSVQIVYPAQVKEGLPLVARGLMANRLMVACGEAPEDGEAMHFGAVIETKDQ